MAHLTYLGDTVTNKSGVNYALDVGFGTSVFLSFPPLYILGFGVPFGFLRARNGINRRNIFIKIKF